MEIMQLAIPGPVVVIPARVHDVRGFLSETFNERLFAARVGPVHFVQENHVFSEHAGTVRGLHFQTPPSAQAKLVRVTRGAIFDVTVDLRHGSPTFGHHASVELSAENGRQLWVPMGFAHGICTLEPRTEVTYKITAHYDPDCDRGIAWDDATLAIPWPLNRAAAVFSDRDRHNPRLKDIPIYFRTDRTAN
jgi:dTDP-4-dehydrorhamnose 3,5-epimerase